MSGQAIVYITADSKKTAAFIAKTLLTQRLIACVSSTTVSSQYWWKGSIVKTAEILLIAKTKKKLVREVIGAVKKIHPYETPEIISVDIQEGSGAYLKWISAETASSNNRRKPAK